MRMVLDFIHEEEGQGLGEYALILALVALVLVGAVKALGGGIGKFYSTVVNNWP